MGIFDNFEIVENVSGVPSVSITKNGIAFNKSTLEKLRSPLYVIALIDKSEGRFAILKSNEHENGARPFYRGKSISEGVRWNNHDLLSTLSKMAGWDLDRVGQKIKGEYHKDGEREGLIFDLSEAYPIEASRKSTNGEVTDY